MKTSMTLTQAKGITGNQSVFALKHMRKALNSLTMLNTPDDKRRLIACVTVLGVTRLTEYEQGVIQGDL